MKRALNLVGGGSKGIIQCGMLKRLHELKIPIDLIFGTSSGSLNAALYSQGDIDLLEHLWMTIRNKDVKGFNPLNVFTLGAIYDHAPLYKTLAKYIDPTKMRIPTWATMTSLQSNSYVRARIDGSLAAREVLLASTAIPGLFPSVTFVDPIFNNAKSFYDGGVTDNYNIQGALDYGADEIIIMHPSRPSAFKQGTLVNTLEWAYQVSAWSIYTHEMQDQGLTPHEPEQAIKKALLDAVRIRVCIPDEAVNCPLFDFDYAGLDRASLVKQGYDISTKLLG